jgi:hypothetical protein
MGGIGQEKGKTQGKNVRKITQNIKMNKCKKSHDKLVTLMHAHIEKDDKQIFRKD